MTKYSKLANFFDFKKIKYTFIVILTLLSCLSFYALILLHWELCTSPNYIFDFSILGFDNYLGYLFKYSKIFAATITVFTVYMVIHTFEDKRKQDLYQDWLKKLDILLSSILTNDDLMVKNIKIRSKVFFDVQYQHKFTITSKEDLNIVLYKMYKNKNEFSEMVNFYEDMNKISSSNGNVYLSQTQTYTFINFRYVFLNLLDNYYIDIGKDLESIYLSALNPKRQIKKN